MTITEQQSSAGREAIAGIKVIDVDTHLTEPPGLWTSRAPKGFEDRVPRVVFAKHMTPSMRKNLEAVGYFGTGEDTAAWVVDEDSVLGPAGGGSVINRANEKIRGTLFLDSPFDNASLAASYAQPRLQMMNDLGIHAQVVFPNVVGFGGQHFAKVTDPELRLLCATLYNDAMLEMQEETSGRVAGMALLPWWDVKASVAEIERIAAMGLKGIITNSDPQNEGFDDLNSLAWDPIWEACESRGLSVNFHVGSSAAQRTWFGTTPWPSLDRSRKLALGSSMLQMGNARIVGNLILSGIFDRFPALRVVSVESGIGWIPYFLESLDYQVIESDVEMALKPSEYFARNMYACFWFESSDSLLDDIRRVGIDNCMFETDFPHPTCLFPDPLDNIGALVEGARRDELVKLMSTTAADVYHFDLSA